jgi:L-serine dehydratase
MTQYIVKEFVKKAKRNKMTLAETVLQYEKDQFHREEEDVYKRLQNSFFIFKKAISTGLQGEYAFKNLMFSLDSKKMNAIKTRILGNTLHKACTYALAITENNLNMGVVIACPTAGASGIVPACIIAITEDYGLTEKEACDALLAASAIELSIIKNASISGAAHGCQAECGSAAAMAAAAIVQLMNTHSRTNPEMIEHAASLALKNTLGLVCDPVAGLVSVPCRKRNAIITGTAFIAAQMALAGIKSYIPFDEVATAMHDIGDRMDDELKETARGGLAKTKCGCRWDGLKEKLLKEATLKKQSFADVLKSTKRKT